MAVRPSQGRQASHALSANTAASMPFGSPQSVWGVKRDSQASAAARVMQDFPSVPVSNPQQVRGVRLDTRASNRQLHNISRVLRGKGLEG